MDLVVPVGSKLFTPSALQNAIDAAKVDLEPGKTHAVVASIDADGAKAALVFGTSDGKWKAVAAYEHDWSGDDKIGGKVIASW